MLKTKPRHKFFCGSVNQFSFSVHFALQNKHHKSIFNKSCLERKRKSTEDIRLGIKGRLPQLVVVNKPEASFKEVRVETIPGWFSFSLLSLNFMLFEWLFECDQEILELSQTT